MPPVSMYAASEEFLPEFPVLFLFDRVIIDARTWEVFKKTYREKGNDLSQYMRKAYSRMADLLFTLYDAGFVRIEDFDSLIRENEALLDEMTSADLKQMETWILPLKESHSIWQEFLRKLDNRYSPDWGREREDPEEHYKKQKETLDEKAKHFELLNQTDMDMRAFLHALADLHLSPFFVSRCG